MKSISTYIKKTGILLLGLFALACNSDDDNDGGETEEEQSSEKAITNFTFLAGDNDALTEDLEGTIDEDAKTITAEVPFGTDVSALMPTIILSEAATIAPDDKETVDFTDAVTYTVTAEDGSEAEYTASITVGASSTKAITALTYLATDNDMLSEDLVGTIDQDARTITLEVPYGMEISELVPTIEISEGAVVDPESKVKTDFTDAVTYTVTGEDGSKAEYTVSVTVGPSGAKEITTFTFLATDNDALTEDLEGTMDEDTKTITAELPYGTDVSGLVPTITISEDATVDPENKTETDFTNIVTYTVTAEDGSEAEYTVSVTVAPSGAKAITTFTFLMMDNEMLTEDLVGIINEDAKTITAEVPYGTDINGLIPTIEMSEGAIVDPENKVKTDFTDAVIYTVTAEDGSQLEYIVSVTVGPSGAKTITAFTFLMMDNAMLTEDITATINEGEKKLTAELPYGTDISSLVPTIEMSEGAMVDPKNKVEADFTDIVTYTVTAEDGSKVEYSVTLLVRTPTEREVLIDLYNANPNNTLNWDLEDGDISNWQGVSVENGSIKQLDFGKKNLDRLPSSIGYLVNLEYLYLPYNSLIDVPKELGSLTSLKELFLFDNSLTSVPSELANLVNLEKLYMQDNSLTSIPKEICDLGIESFVKDDKTTCE